MTMAANSATTTATTTTVTATTMMRKHRQFLFVLIILAALIAPCHARRRKNFKGTERSIRILNQSGVKTDAFWIHMHTREVTESQTEGKGITYGADTGISSFVGHSFEIQELPNAKTNKCRRKMCRKAYFTVNENEEQWFTVTPDFFIDVEDHTTRALKKAKEALSTCVVDKSKSADAATAQTTAAQQLDQMTLCLDRQINATLARTQEEMDFQAGTRRDMGELLVRYACQDHSLNTTVTVHNRTWSYQDRVSSSGGSSKRKLLVRHPMKVLFDSDHSSIQLVEDFVTVEECQAIRQASVPSEDDDETDAGVDNNSINNNRDRKLSLPLKARNGVTNGSMEIKSVLAKIQNLISSAVDIPISYKGKDPLLEVYVQEAGGGGNEEIVKTETETGTEQQCIVDADGQQSCQDVETRSPQDDATPTATATEEITVTAIQDDVVATLMIFCDAPAKGGAIHFPRTGVHVNPVEREALLMIYMDTATQTRDKNAFISEYVACPVREGSMTTIVDSFLDNVSYA